MEDIDLDGLFWIPGEPNKKRAGHLKFSAIDGATLNLLEPLTAEHLSSVFSTSLQRNDLIRLNGVADGLTLTLEHCQAARISTNSNGLVKQRYKVTTILSGVHLRQTDKPPLINSVVLRLRYLEMWAQHPGVDVDFDYRDDSIEKVHLTLASPEPDAAKTAIGDISMIFPCQVRRDPSLTETAIEHHCAIAYRFYSPQILDTVYEICTALRHLVTICVDSQVAIVDTHLTCPDSAIREPKSGRLIDVPIKLYTQWIGDQSQNSESPDPAHLLLSFRDVDGMNGVCRWLDVSKKYHSVISAIVSHWYMPRMYQENRFINSLTAVEAFVRIRKAKQSLKLANELEELAEEGGDTFASLVVDVKAWVRNVIRTRNNYVVHIGLHDGADGARLYRLSQSIYYLLLLILFRECSVPEETLLRMRKHSRFVWLAKKLRGGDDYRSTREG